jgi:hypothetical protein
MSEHEAMMLANDVWFRASWFCMCAGFGTRMLTEPATGTRFASSAVMVGGFWMLLWRASSLG